MKKIIFITLLTAIVSLTLASTTFGQINPVLGTEPVSGGTQPGLGTVGPVSFSQCVKDGNCGVEHLFVLANSVIRWLAGASGALALLMYVIGGMWMIFSSGNPSRVGRGKDILIGTTIALVFIMGSWVLISFTLQALNTKPQFTLGEASCGGSVCGAWQTCVKNQCVDRCRTLAASDTAHTWSCNSPENCDVSYEACKTMNSSSDNCITGFCGGEPNAVCCYQR